MKKDSLQGVQKLVEGKKVHLNAKKNFLSQIISIYAGTHPCIQAVREKNQGNSCQPAFTKGWLDLMSRYNKKFLLLDHNSVLSPLFLPLWSDPENSSIPSFNQELSSMIPSSAAPVLPFQQEELPS